MCSGPGFAEGRLHQPEYEQRIARAYKAQTQAELQMLVADLPQGPVPQAAVVAAAPTVPATFMPAAAGDQQLGDGRAGLRGHGAGDWGLTAIPAVILGHKARAEIRRTGEHGDGQALAGWSSAGCIGRLGRSSCSFVVVLGVVGGRRAGGRRGRVPRRGSHCGPHAVRVRGVRCICFDRSRCDRYALTLCLGCARVLARATAYRRTGIAEAAAPDNTHLSCLARELRGPRHTRPRGSGTCPRLALPRSAHRNRRNGAYDPAAGPQGPAGQGREEQDARARRVPLSVVASARVSSRPPRRSRTRPCVRSRVCV